MNKREMIEKIIHHLVEDKNRAKDMARYYQHKLEDAKEDGRSEYVINHLEERREVKNSEAKEIETLVDFMQELHYEEVK